MKIKKEAVKNKKKRSVWRIVLVVIFSLIFVFSTNGILFALGFFDASILRIIIAIVSSLVFVFSMVGIAWAVGFWRVNNE